MVLINTMIIERLKTNYTLGIRQLWISDIILVFVYIKFFFRILQKNRTSSLKVKICINKYCVLILLFYRVSINVLMSTLHVESASMYVLMSTSMYVLMSTLHVLLLTHIYRVSINVCLNDYITCTSPNPHL